MLLLYNHQVLLDLLNKITSIGLSIITLAWSTLTTYPNKQDDQIRTGQVASFEASQLPIRFFMLPIHQEITAAVSSYDNTAKYQRRRTLRVTVTLPQVPSLWKLILKQNLSIEWKAALLEKHKECRFFPSRAWNFFTNHLTCNEWGLRMCPKFQWSAFTLLN